MANPTSRIGRISAQELLTRYSSGERNFAGCDLSGEIIVGNNLDGIDLTGAILKDVRLDASSLRFANLRDANLQSAHLYRTNLMDTDLSNAVLREVSAEGALMLSAKFNQSDLRDANLNFCAMAGALLDGADLSDAELIATNLSSASIVDARMNAEMGGTVLCDVNLADAQGLAYAVHTGESYVDLSTLNKTANGIEANEHRRDSVLFFLGKCGIPKGSLAAARQLDLLVREDVAATNMPSSVYSFEPANLVRDRYLANDPLREFRVRGIHVSERDIRDLTDVINNAENEEDIQQFIASRPQFLLQHLGGGGHGRWVIPKKRLGGEHVTDFMICAKDSLGFHWTAVELESPHRKLFTQGGDPAEYLRHAIRQIQDWRTWLTRNIGYASRLREESGLGLTDITGEVKGLILIGRRAEVSDSTRDLRERMSKENAISIHTYDYLIDMARRHKL